MPRLTFAWGANKGNRKPSLCARTASHAETIALPSDVDEDERHSKCFNVMTFSIDLTTFITYGNLRNANKSLGYHK